MKKELIFESYYEFQLYNSVLVRIWLEAEEGETISEYAVSAFRAAAYDLYNLDQEHDKQKLAKSLAEKFPKISAVHIQGLTTSIGCIVYKDWP